MKKNYVLIFAFVTICLLTIFTPVRKVIKSVLNDVSEGSNSNKTITASFTYKDSEGNQVHTGEKLYVFISEQDQGQGKSIRIELDANGNEQKIEKLYDQNWSNKNENIENKTYKVIVATPKKGNEAEIKTEQKYDENKFDEYKNGQVYNGSYMISFPEEINFNGESNFEFKLEIKGIDGEKISLEDMLSPMNTATRFGIFALKFETIADVEATIGVKYVEKTDEHTYGLSDRNYKALNIDKSIKVDKTYSKNDKPLSAENVKILLQQGGQTKQTMNCTTDSDGKCSVEFKIVENGIYTVAEEINGQIVSTNQTIELLGGKKIDVQIANNTIEIKDFNDSDKVNYNYNYVEDASSNGNVRLEKMRKPGTLVLGNEQLFEKYKVDQEFQNNDPENSVIVALAGTPGYDRIDFEKEFQQLKDLSTKLATVIDSDNVKAYYMKPDEIQKSDIDFLSEGKEYILVNIDCTNVNEVKIGGRNNRDGVPLYSEESIQNNQSNSSFVYDKSAKIIYNFYTKDGGIINPYEKSIKLEGATTGILLAPAADVSGTSGNHAGTIIAKDYNHTTGEVHQKVKPNSLSSSDSVTIINKLYEFDEQKVTVKKVDASDNPVPGATMVLVDKDNKELDRWTTDYSEHIFDVELQKGQKYTIKELKAPKGYQKIEDYVFVYNGAEEIKLVDIKLIVSKVNEEKQNLVGATLQILDDKGNVVEQWVSGLEDYVVQQSLEPGKTYRLHEYKAPEGYKTANDIEFTLNSDGKDQTIVMEDQKISITVKVDKKDINEKQLAGAHLQILDIYGNVVDEWISDGTIHEVENKLEEGKTYKLHELEAPAGYQISEDIEFTVKTTEKDQIVEMVDEKIVIPGEPRVIIKKTNENKELLEGATLQILDKDGKLIEEWTTNDKEHVIQANLIAGQKYTLHEVSAPKGYKQAEDITFVAKSSDEPQVINMVDKRVKAVLGVVETLDKIARYETIFAITLSLVLLGLYIYRKYNKKYTE